MTTFPSTASVRPSSCCVGMPACSCQCTSSCWAIWRNSRLWSNWSGIPCRLVRLHFIPIWNQHPGDGFAPLKLTEAGRQEGRQEGCVPRQVGIPTHLAAIFISIILNTIIADFYLIKIHPTSFFISWPIMHHSHIMHHLFIIAFSLTITKTLSDL